jgi:hypothetical protein
VKYTVVLVHAIIIARIVLVIFIIRCIPVSVGYNRSPTEGIHVPPVSRRREGFSSGWRRLSVSPFSTEFSFITPLSSLPVYRVLCYISAQKKNIKSLKISSKLDSLKRKILNQK